MDRLPPWAKWLAGITALRFTVGLLAPITPEEAYHWDFARHPDWCYLNHPPMIAWAISVGTAIFGDTALGIRFVPQLMAVGLYALAARMAKQMYGEVAATWTILLLAVQPLTFGISCSGFPDAPLIFFWMLTLYCVWEAVRTEKGGFWLLAGLALGAAMQSKYTSIFLLPTIGGFLVFSKGHRKWLLTPWPWLGGLVAFAVFSPVLHWNWTHHWVSFKYQSSDRFKDLKGLSPRFGFSFLALQWLAILPLTLPLVVAALKRGVRSPRAEDRFLFWTGAPMLACFAAMSWIRNIHIQWPLPCYLPLTIMAAGMIQDGDGRVARFYAAWRNRLLGAAAAGFAVIVAHFLVILPWVPPFPSIYEWPALAEEVRKARPALGERCFTLGIGRKYAVAAAISYYLGDPAGTHAQNLLGREGIQFDYWGDPESLAGSDAVIVVEEADRMSVVMPLLRDNFRSVEQCGLVNLDVGRQVLTRYPKVRYSIYRGRNYQPTAEVRERWRRVKAGELLSHGR